jgi:hypothetical protein
VEEKGEHYHTTESHLGRFPNGFILIFH